MRVAELKGMLRRAATGATAITGIAAPSDLLAVVDALPNTTLLRRMAPEWRTPIEQALADCEDHP